MSDKKVSEINETEADSLNSSDMKSNLNNCNETDQKENELVTNDNASFKEENIDLHENGHQVNSSEEESLSKKDVNLEEESLTENNGPCTENDDIDTNKPVTTEDKDDMLVEEEKPKDYEEKESDVNSNKLEPEPTLACNNTNELNESVNGTNLDKESISSDASSSLPECEDVPIESSQSEQMEEELICKNNENSKIEDHFLSKVEHEPEQDDESKESKMDVDQDDISNSTSDTKTSSLSKASFNVITEVVIGNNDEVTLDLSNTLTNGVKDSPDDLERSSESVKAEKRDIVTSGCTAEDLSLPSKRRNVENGDHSEVNGTIDNDDDNDDDEVESEGNYDELIMPPTPPQDDIEDIKRIEKIKMYQRLKQELLNEDSKLVLLKKLRQNQLKVNISQNNSQHQSSASSTVSATTTSTTGSMGINLTSNLRDLNNLNLLANHYKTSLSQTSNVNSALNFSISHNSKPVSSLVNNNVAHINSHPNLFLKNNLPNLNLAHQTPMQAHLPKTSSHVKGNSVLNSPFAPSLGRSPYNHLNSHLSAPPPSHHGSNNSSKQRTPAYDTPNINTAHSSHRSSLSANSLNRSSMATPPNLAYSDLRQPSSKFNQPSIQSAPSAPPPTTVHNALSDNNRPDPLLAQRQAANVKQVLRKQLEKMPQPKVPAPEMHFIPNPSNAEFICYIGLEKVVDYLTANNQVFHPPEPFECVQCGTDFTPVWKWKDRSDPSKPSVICESCVSKNMKKTVIDEHAKRINTFSKAYEELEKQMATVAAASAGTMTPPSAAISPSTAANPTTGSSVSHATNSNLVSSHSASGNTGSHNLFNSNNQTASAAANFSSIGGGLSGFHQQAHSNSPLSSVGGLTAQQVAAMASFLPQVSNTSAAHQMSTPPAAHSSSRSSNTFASNLAAAFNPSSSNASAQSAAATLALLQQLPKMNPQTQSLLLAQQLQAFTALAGGANTSANAAGNAAMAQLLGLPNLYLSSILAATIANQKSNQNQASTSNSSINAAAAAALQRQFLMDMLPNASGNARSGHSSNSNSSMPHHNWKS